MNRDPAITKRRSDVLSLRASGLSYREIARRLRITVNTVKQDVWQVRRNRAPVQP
jgi:DNA-binding NarL/FixJ family response regulator